jgi:hypothetical protein
MFSVHYATGQRTLSRFVLDDEDILGHGHDAVPGVWREDAYRAERVDIKPGLYNELRRTLPSPDWAHDVPGYSHLRSLVS